MKTKRLYFRKPEASDAYFILSLVNDPLWIRFIGDRDVNNLDDAKRFICDSLNTTYANDELGLRVCCLRSDNVASYLPKHEHNKDTPIGLCGLLQRDYLDALDIGYAFKKEYRGFGYAAESAGFFKALAFNDLHSGKLYASVHTANRKSIALLNNLGFALQGALTEKDEESKTTLLFVCYPDQRCG